MSIIHTHVLNCTLRCVHVTKCVYAWVLDVTVRHSVDLCSQQACTCGEVCGSVPTCVVICTCLYVCIQMCADARVSVGVYVFWSTCIQVRTMYAQRVHMGAWMLRCVRKRGRVAP